jgi:alginate O-acetyltransferase complex protein AlgI
VTWTDGALLAWAGLFVVLAWCLPRRLQLPGMVVVGSAFLLVSDVRSFLVLGAMAVVGLAALQRSKVGIGAAVIIVTMTVLKSPLRLGDGAAGVVPLGLSYYGLRILHVLFDSTRSVGAQPKTLDLLRYLFFFPTFVAGPINRLQGFVRDCRRRRWDRDLFSTGLERVLYGFVKIVVCANFLVEGKLAAWLAAWPVESWVAAYGGCLQYGLNLYLQFAGYSDVAIGIALMVGFRVPENFHWPFAACNIHDFWERWHITLSHWCRDYVFRPVAAATRSPYLGVVASMLVLGAWHELSWRYLAWGVYHGLGLVFWRIYRSRFGAPPDVRRRLVLWSSAAAGWFVTMNFVILSFALTRATSLAETWSIWRTILWGWM